MYWYSLFPCAYGQAGRQVKTDRLRGVQAQRHQNVSAVSLSATCEVRHDPHYHNTLLCVQPSLCPDTAPHRSMQCRITSHRMRMEFWYCDMTLPVHLSLCVRVDVRKARCALHAASATRDFSRQFCVGDDMQIRYVCSAYSTVFQTVRYANVCMYVVCVYVG